MSQLPPDCPPYLPSDEWAFILDRDKHECVHANECRRRGLVCCDQLEIDHEHPKKWGGDDSFANIRLLCKDGSPLANRNRLNVPLSKWATKNIWDEPIDSSLLRHIQRFGGFDEVLRLGPQICDCDKIPDAIRFRNRLLNVITFIPGTTGIGKSLLMQSVFSAFNSIIGLNFPRICSVLWFEPETTLRDLVRTEIKTEGKKLGIYPREPLVQIAKGFDDLLKGPSGADVTLACPQSLWKMERSNKERGPDDKRRVLAQWDTGVFDEVDWADHQNQHIAALWTNALKFSISAVRPV